MIFSTGTRRRDSGAAKAAAMVLMLAMLTACASNPFGGQPDQTAATPPPPPPPPAPPPPAPPPVDLSGKWKLSVAGSGGCVMTLGDNPGATDGSVAPAGGCPGNFFTSRKWTYEHDKLIIRNHKSEVLVELSFDNGSFAGQGISGGGTITLARP
jgi:hypothetical protein